MKKFLLILLTTLISWTAAATTDLTPKFAYKTKGLTATFTNKTDGEYKTAEWNFGDGNNSTDVNPTHTYKEKGMYEFTLTLTTNNNEKVSFEGKIYVFSTSKKKKVKANNPEKTATTNKNTVTLAKTVAPISQPQAVTNVKAFPNPFETTTTIDFFLQNTQQVNIQLFNLSGQVVKNIQNEPLQAGTHQLDINRDNLAAGTYLLQIKTEMNATNTKLVIQ